MYTWNERVSGVVCIRCGRTYPADADDWFTGCPQCLSEGFPAAVDLQYAPPFAGGKVATGRARMADFGAYLPYTSFPTLGEGGTPLLCRERLARECAVAGLWIKNEGQNPSGSHKDRLSPLVVARAAALGRRGVVAASSGNQGASLALYAAAAGVPCAIVTTLQIRPVWARAISASGAKLVMVDEARERWRLMRRMVADEGWFPATNYLEPPVGSHPFGVQGYKTIAFEVVQELGDAPDVAVLPCSRGDLLWGMWLGFREALALGWSRTMPRMVAAEPFPRLSRVLAGEDYRGSFAGSTGLTSIGGNTVTYQAAEAVRRSGGCAVAVGDQEAAQAQERLAREGIYAEGSSAVVLAACDALRASGGARPDDRVVLVVTSSGYKDAPGSGQCTHDAAI